MVALIPAINAETFEEVARRIRMLESLAGKFGFDTVHLDVADGTFTENTIWHDARELVGFETPLKIEAHLMLAEIDMRLEGWLFDPIARIIFHVEAAHDPAFVIQQCRDAKKSAGVAIRPETAWEATQPYWQTADCIQLLSVVPGRAGQAMHEGALGKLRALRAACPSCTIEIDGGVTAENAPALKEAGADWLVAASAIFDAPDIGEALARLMRSIS
ncbi:MAG: hypothetical protein HYT22_02895 [Candidatus Niyogibacteria bacterium]|nr:hypothetical protein [Candidatus Niyogibacteria bacterium]